MFKHLRFDIFEIQETKLPAQLINTTNEGRLVQGQETSLRVVKIIIMTPDEIGDQERMVLLPEIVGEKGFLESISPKFRDRLL
ncbi:hypothetical protein TNCV_3104811 [Trichonephila clavipes]|nr:hypothetical protein TNCV_3104811 [Trichonephila clavipes]